MSVAMDIANELGTKVGRPAFVTFATVAQHLPKASEEQGRYMARDVDMVTVRQIGGTDSCVFEVADWLARNKQEVQSGRLPQAHADLYAQSYTRWKAGQELPVTGTPIKTWPVATPSQVEAMIQMGVRTVEDLAQLNDDGLRRIGMGAVDLKNKAKAWLAAAQDKGKLAQDMAAVQRTNEELQQMVASLTAKVEALQQALPDSADPDPRELSADDILDVVTPPTAKRKR